MMTFDDFASAKNLYQPVHDVAVALARDWLLGMQRVPRVQPGFKEQLVTNHDENGRIVRTVTIEHPPTTLDLDEEARDFWEEARRWAREETEPEVYRQWIARYFDMLGVLAFSGRPGRNAYKHVQALARTPDFEAFLRLADQWAGGPLAKASDRAHAQQQAAWRQELMAAAERNAELSPGSPEV